MYLLGCFSTLKGNMIYGLSFLSESVGVGKNVTGMLLVLMPYVLFFVSKLYTLSTLCLNHTNVLGKKKTTIEFDRFCFQNKLISTVPCYIVKKKPMNRANTCMGML